MFQSGINTVCNNKFIPVILLFLVLIVTCVSYWPGLHGPLLLDDIPNLFHINRFGDGIIGWKSVYLLSPHGFDRPVSITSFIMNWLMTGNNVWALKFTNLVIHIFCGVLIYRLSWLLLSYDLIKDRIQARYTALWIAALWLLSPFLLSTVLYVIQRMAQLSAMFTLLGLLFYVTGRMNIEKKQTPGFSLIIVSVVLFWPLATLSKENGILLPLFILITEYFFFYKNTNRPEIKKLRMTIAALVAIPALVVLGLIIFHPAWLLGGYAGRNFSLYERLITQPRILLDYIGNLLLIPGVTPMGLFHDDYVKSTGLITPPLTLPGLIILPAIIIFSFMSIGKKTSVIFFGFLFYYAAHLVESSFIPLELYFEHRNYLPAFGIYFSVVSGIAVYLQNAKFKYVAVIFLLIAPVTFSVLTYQRALVWQKKTSIYFLSEIQHPDSPRLNEGLGYIYLLNNDPEQALKHLDRVIAHEHKQLPPSFYFKYLLAYCYGHKKMSESEFKNRIKIKSLDNKLSTVIYFGKFIDSVYKGRCNSLDLDKIADSFVIAVNNRDKRYDKADKSYVNELLARLLSYLGRNEEAEKFRAGILTGINR